MNVRLFTMMAVLATTIAVRGDEPAKASQADEKTRCEVEISICQGDPWGDVDDGTFRVLAAPRVVAFSGEEAEIRVGHQKTVFENLYDEGFRIYVKPELLADRKVRARLIVNVCDISETEGQTLVQSNFFETTKTVTPNKLFKIKIGDFKGQWTWAEIKIHTSIPNVPF